MNKFLSFLAIAAVPFFVACSDDSSASADCGCDDSSSNETSVNEDWRTYCIDAINKYRATEDLKPYTLAAAEKQTCADKEASDDLNDGKAHGHFGNCGEFAQNSAPSISLSRFESDSAIVDYYLDMMWSEKKLIESGERDPEKDADFSYIGHYLNMSRTNASKVACGIAKSADGKTAWMNINFY